MAKRWRLPLYGSGKPPKYALVDENDYTRLRGYKWYLSRGGYAVRYENGRPPVFLHSEVLPAPPGMITDHIHRNRLDCRRSHLRIVTEEESRWNRGVQKNNSSGYKGVNKNAKHNYKNPWQARIAANGRRYHLGWFRTARAASLAYDAAARTLHKEFAVLNHPDTPHAERWSYSSLYRNNSSGFRGVSYDKARKLWRARISINGTRSTLGYFRTPQEAACAYDAAAKQLHGPKAFINLP